MQAFIYSIRGAIEDPSGQIQFPFPERDALRPERVLRRSGRPPLPACDDPLPADSRRDDAVHLHESMFRRLFPREANRPGAWMSTQGGTTHVQILGTDDLERRLLREFRSGATTPSRDHRLSRAILSVLREARQAGANCVLIERAVTEIVVR